MGAYFKIPLNLPHAATVASRLRHHLRGAGPVWKAEKLQQLLDPYFYAGENPPNEEAMRVTAEATQLAREIVDEIERLGIGHDKLGQAVRNLFECLAMGEEGASLSLRAGEKPDSALRPL